ncbi:MAG TPA: hypothetical protein VJ343_01950 [archaeon]|nr:hypothetical protein [archaeon]
MDKKIGFLIVLTLVLIQLSALVYAQVDVTSGVNAFLDIIGIPREWQKMPELLYYFIVPFLGIWAIVLGFLRIIPIFRYHSRIEYVITFAIAFSTVWPTGWLMLAVKAMFVIIGVVTVFAFGILFLFGVLIYAWLTGKGFWGFGGGSGGTVHQLDQIKRDKANLAVQIQKWEQEKMKLQKGDPKLIELEHKIAVANAKKDALTEAEKSIA